MRIVYEYRGSESVLETDGSQVVIGRPKNGIKITLDLSPDLSVSRPHAQIVEDDTGLWIEDLDSSHGTFVNHRNISQCGKQRLGETDLIIVGETKIRVLSPEDSQSATRASEVHDSVTRREGCVETLKRIEDRLQEIENAIGRQSVETVELRKAIEICHVDPFFALPKARQLIERVVRHVYEDQLPNRQTKPLFDMIEDLVKLGNVLPKNVASYLHLVRVLGNLVIHPPSESNDRGDSESLSESDVELTMLTTLHLVDWFSINYQAPDPPGSTREA